ncbi:hypothetical protein ABVK25_006321 [Lepraria finkii]|uniref:Uncharacterized protein n=1 Tax=Lepraria finkii TaxID=1340010 RepID=A0ABR4B7H8_9LECA
MYSKNSIDYNKELATMSELSKRGDLFVELFGWFEDTDHILLQWNIVGSAIWNSICAMRSLKLRSRIITAQLLEGLNNEMRTQSRTTKDKKGEAFERFDTTQQLGFIHKILDRN